MNLYTAIILCALSLPLFSANSNCQLPKNLIHLDTKSSLETLLSYKDMKRNSEQLKTMCVHMLSFDEGQYLWWMVLVYNPNKVKGPFWFLPHDDENTAFDSTVYATQKYGGGFLAVISNDNRYYKGQDPNRNFGESKQTAQICKQQNHPAPLYSKYVFKVINSFRKSNMPYLAMHNNKNGWYGNGGSGGISILKISTTVRSYPSKGVLVGKSKGIRDEDSLFYIAGTEANPPAAKLKALLDAGMNVKYEVVNKKNNDCSMSNYVVLVKRGNYYNIETEHGDILAQKRMIDELMKILKVSPIIEHQADHNLGVF